MCVIRCSYADFYPRTLPKLCWSDVTDDASALIRNPDSKVHGANMGPSWGRQDPGGWPHELCYLGMLWFHRAASQCLLKFGQFVIKRHCTMKVNFENVQTKYSYNLWIHILKLWVLFFPKDIQMERRLISLLLLIYSKTRFVCTSPTVVIIFIYFMSARAKLIFEYILVFFNRCRLILFKLYCWWDLSRTVKSLI